MAISDYTIVETKNGFRIHRASCKRQGNSSPLKDAIDFAPGNVMAASLASCCKPKGARVYIDALDPAGSTKITTLFDAIKEIHAPAPEPVNSAKVLARVTGSVSAVVVHEHRTPEGDLVVDSIETSADEELDQLVVDAEVEESETNLAAAFEELIGTVSAPVDEPAPEEVKPEEAYAGVSKHYHAALLKTGATRDEALAAFAALKKWRREDADYKALPPQDTKWATSERYAWERDFLIGYMAGVAGIGDEGEQTYASVRTPALRGYQAWLADYNADDVL